MISKVFDSATVAKTRGMYALHPIPSVPLSFWTSRSTLNPISLVVSNPSIEPSTSPSPPLRWLLLSLPQTQAQLYRGIGRRQYYLAGDGIGPTSRNCRLNARLRSICLEHRPRRCWILHGCTLGRDSLPWLRLHRCVPSQPSLHGVGDRYLVSCRRGRSGCTCGLCSCSSGRGADCCYGGSGRGSSRF